MLGSFMDPPFDFSRFVLQQVGIAPASGLINLSETYSLPT
jgi:hypothetical protein